MADHRAPPAPAWSPDFDHETTLPYVIVRLAESIRQAFAEAIAEADLTPAQFGVLVEFAGDRPMTAAAIARAAGRTPQAIGPQIEALVAHGLITRTPRPGRGRPHELRLTSEGTSTLERATAIARAERDRVTGHLSRAEQETLLAQLREIGARAEGRGPRSPE